MKTRRTAEDYDNPPIAIDFDDLLYMINENKMVVEHYVNLWKKSDMEKYKDEVYRILVNGYKNNGGLLGMDSPDQLVAETDFWKICKRNNKITAAFCYSTKRGGRKACYGSCLMTREGKYDMYRIMKADMDETGRQVWAEVSDKIEHIYIEKMHIPVIPAETARLIMKDKKFEKIDPDGYHYWRKIGGELKRKVMIGIYDENLLHDIYGK